MDKQLSIVPSEPEEIGTRKRSQYRGVYWSVSKDGWLVILYKGKKKFTLTHVFKDEEKAALAFDAMVKFNHAPVQLLNFPEQPQLKLVK